MESKYQNLDWSLKNKPEAKDVIFKEYGNNEEYLDIIENLILDLRSLNCECIQEEMEELIVPRKPEESRRNDFAARTKLYSIISELEFAKMLAEKYSGVKFVANGSGFKRQSPDIFCRETNSYFEVYRLGDDPHIHLLASKLEEFLENFPCMVNIYLKEKLLIPKLRGTERKEQEKAVEESLETFYELFPSFFPSERSIETKDIKYQLKKTESGNGYIGFIVPDNGFNAIEISEEKVNDMLEYIKGKLVEKAGKRETFEGDSRSCSYIIIFDSHEYYVRERYINRLLYGETIVFSPSLKKTWESEVSNIKKLQSWEEIEIAKNNGWEPFLFEKCLIPHDNTLVDTKGIFFSEPSMKNISGVLFRNGKHISFYPNPFCSDEINNPDIQNFEICPNCE